MIITRALLLPRTRRHYATDAAAAAAFVLCRCFSSFTAMCCCQKLRYFFVAFALTLCFFTRHAADAEILLEMSHWLALLYTTLRADATLRHSRRCRRY